LMIREDLFGVVVYIVVVRFKCSVCGTTVFFVHCCHVYDAHAIHTCLYHRVTTGHVLLISRNIDVNSPFLEDETTIHPGIQLSGGKNPQRSDPGG